MTTKKKKEHDEKVFINNEENMENDFEESYRYIHGDNATITGLKNNLTSSVRTEALKVLAKNRGLRLRVIRQITNTSLEEFSKLVGIESGSLGRIERGSTCLSILKAKFISDQLINHNLLVNPIWLLSGKGVSIKKILLDKLDVADCITKTLSDNHDHDLNNKSVEFMAMSIFFKKIYYHKKPVTMFMNDNHMDPIIKKNDLLGGLIVEPKDYVNINGKPCIINFKNHTSAVRNIFIEDQKVLLVTNVHSKPQLISLEHVEYIAPIHFIQCSHIDSQYVTCEQENISDKSNIHDSTFINVDN